MTRAIIIFIIYSLPLINFGQNKVSEGLIDMELEGITSVVSDIVLSPDGNKLFLCGNANRAYLYDVSQKESAQAHLEIHQG
jgi:WD40 repeat protein